MKAGVLLTGVLAIAGMFVPACDNTGLRSSPAGDDPGGTGSAGGLDGHAEGGEAGIAVADGQGGAGMEETAGAGQAGESSPAGGSTQAGGQTQAGGSSGSGGQMQAGGTRAAGGAASAAATDKSKEHVWLDRDVAFSGGRPDAQDKPPANWFAPNDYMGGQILTRFNVTRTIDRPIGIEFCLWNQGRHGCIAVAFVEANALGTVTRTYGIARNVLIGGLTEEDFKGGIEMRNLRLFDRTDRTKDIAGPVTGHLTVVLVPKGLAFSGWDP